MENTINSLIASGRYKDILMLVKSFRNGLVYGCQVRAPHALVMTALWSRGPLKSMALRIFNATKQHGLGLGKFAFFYKAILLVLSKLNGGVTAPWHTFVAGAVCGYHCWGDRSAVHVQVNMYILSRILSGLIHLLMERSDVVNRLTRNRPSSVAAGVEGSTPPSTQNTAFRLYAGLIWGIVMFLFYCHPHVLQWSLQTSMQYIYKDSDEFTDAKSLLLYNKAKNQ